MKQTDNLFEISISGWRIQSTVGCLPSLFNKYIANAAFVDQIDMQEAEHEGISFHAISAPYDTALGWPQTVIVQRFSPSGGGFNPGLLIVPETSILFLGGGKRLTGYDLSISKMIWEDYTPCGFWGWEQHGDVIVMMAELEFAAWNINGEKLWCKKVEPPWSHTVVNNRVTLDVMGRVSRFDAKTGE